MQSTVDEIERRILRACKTIRALPDREARFFRYHSLWPDIPQAAEEAYGYDEAREPPFRPRPSDVSDCLAALALLRGLSKPERRLIWWVSLGWGFGNIAARIGRSIEEAKLRYREAIHKLWASAQPDKIAYCKPSGTVYIPDRLAPAID